MLALVGIYWAIAVFGIIDLDFLDLNFDIDADGDVDVDADLDADTGGGFIAGALEFIHLGSLPLMVVVSGLVICAWSFAVIGNFYLNPSDSGLIGFLISAAVAAPGIVVSSLALWPIAAFYKRLEDKTDGNLSMIGRTCRVRSDRVDEGFGQAEVKTVEGPLVVNVRIAAESVALKEGDAALIIGEDSEHMLYTVRKIADELTQI